MTPYVSLDIETTGLDPANCQILEVGAVLDDWTTPINDLSRFHCYVTHDQIIGEPTGLAMNARLLRIIADRSEPGLYLRPKEILGCIASWLLAKGIDTQNVLAAGKNFASFDLRFLSKLPGYGLRLKFHHRFLDPAMLYWKPDIDQTPPHLGNCMARAGIGDSTNHRALDDALLVVKLLRHAALRKPRLYIGGRSCVLHLPESNYLKVREVARKCGDWSGLFQDSGVLFSDSPAKTWVANSVDIIGRENVDRIQDFAKRQNNAVIIVVKL